MVSLTPHIRNYDWGSRTLISEFCHSEPATGKPEAEYWYGAHHSGTACFADGTSLRNQIEIDPIGQLGPRVVQEFGPRLPFLIKLIAAERPLSLQAHPTLSQARAGFDRETRSETISTHSARTYSDSNHKPEVLIAISPFNALVGFRPIAQTLKLINALDITHWPIVPIVDSGRTDEATLRQAFSTCHQLEPHAVAYLIAELAEKATAYLGQHRRDSPWILTAQTLTDLARRYPSDPGVLSAVLLNRLSLAPGDAIYISPGEIHAYLDGLGLEVMANSDNVVRGGLTTKPVDLVELTRILNFSPNANPTLRPTSQENVTQFETRYPLPVPDFQVSKITLPKNKCTAVYTPDGPEVLVCIAGHLEAQLGRQKTPAHRGAAIWVPSSTSQVQLRALSDTTVYRVRV